MAPARLVPVSYFEMTPTGAKDSPAEEEVQSHLLVVQANGSAQNTFDNRIRLDLERQAWAVITLFPYWVD
jgi:hypothetical protein